MSELLKKNLRELLLLIEKREVSSSEVYRAFLERIYRKDDEIKAFISVEEEQKYIKDGKFKGIPVGIKDNIITKGIKTTCASRFLENFIPPYDSTAVKKLKENGFSIIGKTNLDEFAMGSSTENSAFFTTKNPWDLERVPGGSSGGSAAAVASLEVPVALGSDTGGSVRQPAAFCGVYGLKPTYGRVSRFGLVAFASSLDQIGILARNPYDIALTLEIISGRDPNDATSSDREVENYSQMLEIEPKNTKIAVLKVPEDSLSSEIKEAYKEYISFFEEKGFEMEEIEIELWEYGLYVYYIIASSEASANLARYDGVRYGERADSSNIRELYLRSRNNGFGKEVKRRILLGTFSLSSGFYDEYYMKAVRVRNKIAKNIGEVFERFDFIILPTTPETAFKIGEKADDPISMYYSDYFTIPSSLGGFPAINIPFKIGETSNLPIGFQIISNYFEERKLLSLANFYENEIKFENKIIRRF